MMIFLFRFLLICVLLSQTMAWAQVCPARLDKKWGLIDNEGNWVVKPSYNYIDPIIGNLFRTSGGLISSTGEVIIAQHFFEISYIGEGVLIAKSSFYGPLNIFDTTGTLKDSGSYKKVLPFHNGMAQVMGVNGLWGAINKSCKLIIPCKYDLVSMFTSYGKSLVVSKTQAQTFLVDTSGSYLYTFPFIFRVAQVDAGHFFLSEDTTLVITDMGAIVSVGDAPLLKTEYRDFFCSQDTVLGIYCLGSGATFVNFFSASGQLLKSITNSEEVFPYIPSVFCWTGPDTMLFINSFNREGTVGYKSKSRGVIIPPVYSEITGFEYGYVLAKKKKKWIILSANGQIVPTEAVDTIAETRSKSVYFIRTKKGFRYFDKKTVQLGTDYYKRIYSPSNFANDSLILVSDEKGLHLFNTNTLNIQATLKGIENQQINEIDFDKYRSGINNGFITLFHVSGKMRIYDLHGKLLWLEP